jgi:nicotinamidase-related amidase
METSALLIVDMQNDFVLPDSPFHVAGAMATVPTIIKLLNSYREHSLPIFHIVREYRADGSDIEHFRYPGFMEGQTYAIPGTNGCDIVDELKPLPGEYRIVKRRFSAFMNTELDLMLRRKDIEHVVITGTQYPNCIRATAYDAVALDYQVTVVTDATSAASNDIAECNIRDMENIGIRCISSSELFASQDC